MNSKPLISFCIPTFNRIKQVSKLVEEILTVQDDDIEVIVLDNGSNDGTYEKLRQIIDPRLKVRSNGINYGALFNMVNVFDDASGEFVVYSTDQDTTVPDRIKYFKSFLNSHRELACGYCSFEEDNFKKNKIYSSGIQAVEAIAYRGRHPTGYFFRNTILHEINLKKRFSDYNKVHLFPLEFALAEAAIIGDGAIYSGNLFKPNQGSDVVNHKSSTTNGAMHDAFFKPETRLKLAISYSEHVDELKLSKNEKNYLKAKLFIDEIFAATIGYSRVLNNYKLCIHYVMELRRVTNLELFNITLYFSFGYYNARFKNDKLNSIRFTYSLLKLVLRKIKKRFFLKIIEIKMYL